MKRLSLLMAILLATLSGGVEARPALGYNVIINGTVNTNNIPFQSFGSLAISPTITTVGTGNGINPVDVALVSGNPPGGPVAGGIWYFTNSAMYTFVGGSGDIVNSTLDYAYVSVNGGCYTIQPDANFLMGLSRTNPSVFTVSSSLVAQLYYVIQGTMTVCSNDNWRTVFGSINYLGTSFYSSPFPSMPYQATFTGSYFGNVNF